MAPVAVTGIVKDETGRRDSREWLVSAPAYREGATGEVVSTKTQPIQVVAGVFTATLEPGPALLVNPDGKKYFITVPDVDADLWDLIALSVGVPPEAPQQWVTDAVNAWLEDNPPGGGGSTDLTVSRTATAVTVLSSNGADATLPAADASNAGVMTATMQTKLAGIATGATANDTDANLKNRANHTGSQTSATISDFTEAVQDAVAALLAAGTNVTLNYDDTGNTLTVSASGGGGGLDAEAVRDTIGVALLGTGNISVTVNDAADTITVSTTATVNSTDAALRDRSTHTGTQSADTITDGTTNKAYTAAEKTKLAGIAVAATANSTDSALRDRSTHTGTQSADTITDGTTNKAYTATEKSKLSGIEAAADVTDAANVAAAGALMTSAAPELIRDTIGAALVAGSNITISPNDGADTITISSTGGGSTECHYLRWTGTAWPTRPSDGLPTIWVGGDAPVDAPTARQAGDVWFPDSGDDIDLGVVLEALQGITASASTVPYFDAINHAASLAFKIVMSGSPNDTSILSEKAVKDAITAALTSPTLVNPTITNYTETVYDEGNSGSSKTLGALSNGTMRKITLTANTTLTVPAPAAGKSLIIAIHTGAGGFTCAFSSASGSVRWPNSSTYVATTTASRIDFVTLVSHDGTNWYASYAQNFTP